MTILNNYHRLDGTRLRTILSHVLLHEKRNGTTRKMTFSVKNDTLEEINSILLTPMPTPIEAYDTCINSSLEDRTDMDMKPTTENMNNDGPNTDQISWLVKCRDNWTTEATDQSLMFTNITFEEQEQIVPDIPTPLYSPKVSLEGNRKSFQILKPSEPDQIIAILNLPNTSEQQKFYPETLNQLEQRQDDEEEEQQKEEQPTVHHEQPKLKSSSVRFDPLVSVVDIPSSSDYTPEQKDQLWNNRTTLRAMVYKNRLERSYERRVCGGEAIEDEHFYLCQNELIHPVHVSLQARLEMFVKRKEMQLKMATSSTKPSPRDCTDNISLLGEIHSPETCTSTNNSSDDGSYLYNLDARPPRQLIEI
jgi:hypothetical protein